MSKTRELIICIISIIALVLAVTTTVFATDGTPDLNSLMSNSNTEGNDFEEIPEANNTNTNIDINTNTNTNVNTNTDINTNTNVNNNTNTTTSIVIIAICGVSAIYAYKKIKDYNNL